MKAVILFILLSLLACILMYVGYRPMDVGMCKVAVWIVGHEAIVAFRQTLPTLPPWAIYSLPGALWTGSAFSVLGLTIRRLPKRLKQSLLAMVLLLPLGMEIFQLLHWTDGTYDPVDILFFFLGGAAGALMLVLIPDRTGLRLDWKWVVAFFVSILFFGDQW